MKYSWVLVATLMISVFSGSAYASGKISQEMRDDAEYMMRKIVKDIHDYKVHTTVTDMTRDKGIEVMGFALKFIPNHKDKKTGESFSCARVSLDAKIRSGTKTREQIKRTDQICKNLKSGREKYLVNIQ